MEHPRYNLNEASKEDLQKIPGVGEETAESMIEYRQSHGGFHDLEELSAVSALNSEHIKQMKEWVTL
jgi:competence protein ComEA